MATNDEKMLRAQRYQRRFATIQGLHKQEFAPAARPLAPNPPHLSPAVETPRFRRAATKGIRRFNRAERAEAHRIADAAADNWVTATNNENATRQSDYQLQLDARWNHLENNHPETVRAALTQAFRDFTPNTGIVAIDGAAVTLVVDIPDIDAVPEHMPSTTSTGRLSLKKLTKTTRNAWYRELVSGLLLTSAKRAFAEAPGIEDAFLVAMNSWDALMAARVNRSDLARARRTSADALDQLVDAARGTVTMNLFGQAKELRPLDSFDRKTLRGLRATLHDGHEEHVESFPPIIPPHYLTEPTQEDLAKIKKPLAPQANPRPQSTDVVSVQAAKHSPSYARAFTGTTAPPNRNNRANRARGLVGALVLLIAAIFGTSAIINWPEPIPATLVAGSVSLDNVLPPTLQVQSIGSDGVIYLKPSEGSATGYRLAHVVQPTRDECLATETARELRRILPAGTHVTGFESNELAVEGELVAAMLAKKGLAVADPAGSPTQIEYQRVVSAQETAREAGVGIYSTTTPCSPLAHLEAYAVAATEFSAAADGMVAVAVLEQSHRDQAAAYANDIGPIRDSAHASLEQDVSRWPLVAFTATEIDEMRVRLLEIDAIQEDAAVRADERIVTEDARLETERVAAEQAAAAEAARIEAERQAAERAAAQPAPQPFVAPAPAPAPVNSGAEPWNMPGPDLNCSDIRMKVRITGPDYHGLDRDGDGWGCDSYG